MPAPKRSSPVGIVHIRSQARYSGAIAAVWNSLRCLNSILQCCFASGTRAMNAAEDFAVGFHPVPNDSTIAMRANWCQSVDRAFEAIERVMLTGYDHFKRLIIFILANFACSHT